MKPNEVYATAWRFISEQISDIDMSEHNLSKEVIDAIDSLTATFEKQARQLEAEQKFIHGTHSNLIAP